MLPEIEIVPAFGVPDNPTVPFLRKRPGWGWYVIDGSLEYFRANKDEAVELARDLLVAGRELDAEYRRKYNAT